MGGQSVRLISPASFGGFTPPMWLRPADQVISSGGGFLPSDEPGLVLWVESDGLLFTDLGITPATTNGDLVEWVGGRDAAPHNFQQTSAGSRPSVAIPPAGVGQNGKPVLDFDGIDDFIMSVFSLAQPHTRFLVVSVGTAGTLIADGTTPNSAAVAIAGGLSESYAGALLVDGPASLDVWQVWTAVFDGGASSLQIGNGGSSIGDAGNSAADGMTIGSAGGSGAYTRCRFIAAVGYDHVVTDLVQQKVRDYLSLKWAVPL